MNEYKNETESREKKKDEEGKQNSQKVFRVYKLKIAAIINDLTRDFNHKKPSEFFRE